MVAALEGFLALSFDFLLFIIGFFIKKKQTNKKNNGCYKRERKKVNLSCISASSAVSATPCIFRGKVVRNWKGVMIVVVRSY